MVNENKFQFKWMVTLRHVTIIMMPMVMLMAMMKTMVTSSVSDPKRRRSKGMAATRSIINQPLVNNIIVKTYCELSFSKQKKPLLHQWEKEIDWIDQKNWISGISIIDDGNPTRRISESKKWWRFCRNSFPSKINH